MKKAIIKIYRPDGTIIDELENASFVTFRKEINAGMGECVIRLHEKFDYEGSTLMLGNLVKIFISDNDTSDIPEGYYQIYSGYISQYSPWVMRGRKGIELRVLGHYTKLDTDILKDGVQTTLYTHATTGLTTTDADLEEADVGIVMKAVIDLYKASGVIPSVFYTPETLKETSTDIEYIFELKTYREAIDKLLSMSPPNWWWYLDQLGTFYFKSAETTPKHTFVFGQHFSDIKVEHDMETIRNVFLFWNGETGADKIYKAYQDDASVLTYGRRAEKYYDWKVGLSATADEIAARFLDKCKNPEIKVECAIIDNNEDPINGYDIESIEPGDTCTFRGFNSQVSDIFRENMLITKVEYQLSKVLLTIQVQKSGMIEWNREVARQADDYYSREAPETYTV
jgi:hypothetical protein